MSVATIEPFRKFYFRGTLWDGPVDNYMQYKMLLNEYLIRFEEADILNATRMGVEKYGNKVYPVFGFPALDAEKEGKIQTLAKFLRNGL